MFQFIRLFITVVFLLGVGQALAVAAPKSDTKKEEVPPWMENADKTGNSTYLVPKNAKVERIAGQVVVEPPAEYVARQVYEMDKRQAAMEKELAAVKKELAELREQCALQQQSSSEKAP
mgnify:CR=1 FL=1